MFRIEKKRRKEKGGGIHGITLLPTSSPGQPATHPTTPQKTPAQPCWSWSPCTPCGPACGANSGGTDPRATLPLLCCYGVGVGGGPYETHSDCLRFPVGPGYRRGNSAGCLFRTWSLKLSRRFCMTVPHSSHL